jgi:hypothetical protein
MGIFIDKQNEIRQYLRDVRNSDLFRELVHIYNEVVRPDQAELHLVLPDFVRGDYNDNPQQFELDNIRWYNGWNGYGLFVQYLDAPKGKKKGSAKKIPYWHLHEFQLKFMPAGDVNVLSVTAGTNTVEWEEVPVEDRPKESGDPDYVQNVLQSPDSC